MANPGGDKDRGNTSSGHGALGMGGQPDDNPRDQAGGHEDLPRDDRPRKTDGASGSGSADHSGGGSANETVGVGGDEGNPNI